VPFVYAVFLCKRIVAAVTVFGRKDICHFAGY